MIAFLNTKLKLIQGIIIKRYVKYPRTSAQIASENFDTKFGFLRNTYFRKDYQVVRTFALNNLDKYPYLLADEHQESFPNRLKERFATKIVALISCFRNSFLE